MDEGEHLHPGLAGDRGRLADSRVAGVERALGLLLGEAGVVDEELGAPRRLDRRLTGAGVAGDDDRPPGRDSPTTCSGPDRPGGALHPLASLQRGEGRAFPDAQPLGLLRVESARPLVLDQGVAEGPHAVLDRKGADLASLERDPVAGLELDQSSLKPIRPTAAAAS